MLSVGNLYNPDVRYSYNIPIEDKPQQFIWDAYGPWQECSRPCQGEGWGRDVKGTEERGCRGYGGKEKIVEECGKGGVVEVKGRGREELRLYVVVSDHHEVLLSIVANTKKAPATKGFIES